MGVNNVFRVGICCLDILPQGHPEIGNWMHRVAREYGEYRYYKEALHLMQETLTFSKKISSENKELIADCMDAIAYYYSELGDNNEAVKSQQSTVLYVEKHFAKTHEYVRLARRALIRHMQKKIETTRRIGPELPPKMAEESGDRFIYRRSR